MHALPAPFGRNRKHMHLDPVTRRAQGFGPVCEDLGSAQGAVDHEMGATAASFRDQHLHPTPGIRLRGVRRLHDTGRSGWWLLIGLIPLVGAIVLIVFFVQDSQPDNQYGPNPKGLAGGQYYQEMPPPAAPQY